MAVSTPLSPKQLRGLSLEQMQALAEDFRQEILKTCLKNGGHLGPSLGAVELALALHFVFDSPREPIIWDVGHQAYAHKLLTGRWESFSTLRKKGGLSGFLRRAESEHDVFGAGHSSTAISAALAMAWARERDPKTARDWTVAVVGDGGLTAGLAFEALNNVRSAPMAPLLIVLNDNQLSISRNVGSISTILDSRRADGFFSLFGLEYVGPVDGHDLAGLLGTLRGIRASNAEKPVLLHVLTQKGKGYAPAEELPTTFHGIGPLQEKLPEPRGEPQKTYSTAFGEALCTLAEQDQRVLAVTAAMPEGTGLTEFARRFPDRFFDVGIAEQHAVTFAAGLATQGYRPVVALYSTFLQRALDSVIHDVVLQKLPVVFAIDRAGLVGSDGPTHHGAFDLAFLGAVPGLRITAPARPEDIELLLSQALSGSEPFALRYPRGAPARAIGIPVSEGLRWIRGSENSAAPELIAVALGASTEKLDHALAKLGEKSSRVTAISTMEAKPFSPRLLSFLRRHPGVPLLICEDAAIRGGFGQALASELGLRSGAVDFAGYPDEFFAHGSVSELEALANISPDALERRMRALLK